MNPDEQVIVKIVGGVAGIEHYPDLVEHIDRYVTRYEPSQASLQKQWVWTTGDPAEALGFADHAEMHEWYTQTVGIRPWDGRPDRPLTAFHIMVGKRSTFAQEVTA